ncbi:unnamed protein product, partial [Allacma fusca]
MYFCSPSPPVKEVDEIYVDEWIRSFASCRIEIYADPKSDLAFFNQKYPIVDPVVLTKVRLLYLGTAKCPLSHHIDQCHANLFLPNSIQSISSRIQHTASNFLSSYIPATQHYYFVGSLSKARPLIHTFSELRPIIQGRAEYTHIIYIILREDFKHTRSAVKFPFKSFVTVCVACQKKTITKIHQDNHHLWIPISSANPKRLLDLGAVEETRTRLLKNVQHVLRFSHGAVTFSNDPILQDRMSEFLKTLVNILQTQFSNSSLLLQHPSYPDAARKLAYNKRIVVQYPNIFHRSGALPYTSSVVITGTRHFNFITCVSPDETTNVQVYLDPFDMNIWIGLLLSCIIFAFIFWRLSRSTSTSFNSLFLVLSVLVENCKLPEIFTRRPLVRVVVGIFFVFAMIVENSYKGKITASVTAPKPKKNLETFDDLLQGFRIYSPISEKVQPYSHNRASWEIVLEMKRRALDTQKNQIQNQHVSSSGFSNLIHYRPLLTQFGMEIFVVLAYAVTVNSSAKYRDISQLHRILRMEAVPEGFPDVSIEEEVSKCNKSVFVDFDDQLDQFVPAFSKGTTSPFIKGKENFLQQRLGWTFQNENKCGGLLSRFIKRFLADSGIESWMEFKLPGL